MGELLTTLEHYVSGQSAWKLKKWPYYECNSVYTVGLCFPTYQFVFIPYLWVYGT